MRYRIAYKLGLAQTFVYRLSFLFDRLRFIVFLLLLYYMWSALSVKTGRFAGFTAAELTTYVFLANIIRAVVFGSQSYNISEQINDGTFSIYLVRPINHFLFVYYYELAERTIYLGMSIAETLIVGWLLHINFFIQFNAKLLIIFLLSLFLAHALYYCITYAVSMLAFWTHEFGGPRFLFEWLLEMTSGSYFPLAILSGGLLLGLKFLPFAYLIYSPLTIYLGKENLIGSLMVLAAQVFWIAVAGLIAWVLWKRGLRRYAGEGI